MRDASKVTLKPHVIPHRVTGASSHSKENIEEAEEIAALVVAATEQPEYADKTFGVISLVGDQQAYKIDLLLRKHLSEEEFKLQHNILCGNPAQFQGDERDVIFLSVVDTSDGGVLPLREEPMFKQRFNVAASRSRDQMWVVHSIDPRSHLKPRDLRRRLIEYAEDPYRVLKALENVGATTESPFEKDVANRLVRLGYKVIPQWRVGHYRIDLVVEGDRKRIAIECDGDKFHPLEKLADDMARQAVLERLGWSFIRIRGSQFFRDPEQAMTTVLEKVRAAGIEPHPEEPSVDTASAQGYELVERLVRRARELRRQWQESDGLYAGQRAFRAEATERAEPFATEVPDDLDGDDESSDAEDTALGINGSRVDEGHRCDSIRGAIYAILPSAGKIEREALLRQSACIRIRPHKQKLRSRLNKTIGAEVRYGRIQMDSDHATFGNRDRGNRCSNYDAIVQGCFTMNRRNNAAAYVIVISGLLLFGTACGSGHNGYGTNQPDYKNPETKDTGKKEPQADEEKANTGFKTLETPLRDIGKKEPQTREEKAERVCHQAKELEGLDRSFQQS